MTFSTAVPLSPWQVLSGQNVLPVSLTDQTGSTATVTNPQPVGIYTRMYGEDSTLDALWGGWAGSSVVISTASVTQIKTSPGVLNLITILNSSAAGILLFNNTSAAGAPFGSFQAATPVGTYKFEGRFSSALTISTGAINLFVSYR